METKKSSILDFLSEKNFIEIPIWHREFSWAKEHIIQLYEDIEALIDNAGLPAHFFGVLVHEPSALAYSATTLVDGHQRLIATSLLICAICNHFKAENYKTALLFSLNPKDKIPKIHCYNKSSDEYENILLNADFAYMEDSIYSRTYRYFLDKIESGFISELGRYTTKNQEYFS